MKTDVSSNLDIFLREYCELAPEFHISKQNFYHSFSLWLKSQNAEETPSKTAIGKEMNLKGFSEVRTKLARCWDGIRISDENQLVEMVSIPLAEKTTPKVENPEVEPSNVEKFEATQVCAPFSRNDALDALLLKNMFGIRTIL